MSASSCAVPLIMLRAEAMYSLSVSINALYAELYNCIVLKKFWSRENSFEEIYVILAKFAPQSWENCKILGLDPG